MKEIVTIQISKFLTNELAEKLDRAQWKGLQINRSRQYVFDELTSGNDCFDVVAAAPNGNIIGRIYCVRNETDPRLWYYGDLFVLPEYRRLASPPR